MNCFLFSCFQRSLIELLDFPEHNTEIATSTALATSKFLSWQSSLEHKSIQEIVYPLISLSHQCILWKGPKDWPCINGPWKDDILKSYFQLKKLEEEKKGPNCIECLLSIRFFNRKLKWILLICLSEMKKYAPEDLLTLFTSQD